MITSPSKYVIRLTPSANVGTLLSDGNSVGEFTNTAPLQFYPVNGSPVLSVDYVVAG